jgi:hypothetical protein
MIIAIPLLLLFVQVAEMVTPEKTGHLPMKIMAVMLAGLPLGIVIIMVTTAFVLRYQYRKGS